MTDEQAASKSEPDAKQSGQDEGAQDDDLDTLLAQYDEESKEETKPQPKMQPSGNKLDEIYEFIQHQRQKEVVEAQQKDISKSVKQVKEMLGAEIDDEDVMLVLNGMADVNPNIREAWERRHKNPAAWNAALKKVANKVRRMVPSDDDKEAVAAAVKSGSSAKAEPDKDFPSEKEIRNMSDEEFRKIWG